MVAVHKSKKQKKSSHKLDVYGDAVRGSHFQKKIDDFTFDTNLKTSAYSVPQDIDTGKNPVFRFPIPPIEPIKANMMNDEVDMYFPRKHFFRKFQSNFDLLDNIIMKPIPVDKILPPTLFPSPIIDGTLWKTKREMLFKSLKERDSETGLDTQKDIPESDINLKSKANIKDETESGLEETKNEGPDNEALLSEEDLSDYDPDFEVPKQTINNLSEKETRLIDAYINTRMQMKSSNDFFFGDPQTMKLQEQSFCRELNRLEKTNETERNVGEKYMLTMDLLDILDTEFSDYTAASIDKFNKKIDEVEETIAERKNIRYQETKPFLQYETNKFDYLKSSITPAAYAEMKAPKFTAQSDSEKKDDSVPYVNTESNTYSLNAKAEEKPITDSSAFDFENNMLYGPDLENGEDDAFGSLTNEMFFE